MSIDVRDALAEDRLSVEPPPATTDLREAHTGGRTAPAGQRPGAPRSLRWPSTPTAGKANAVLALVASVLPVSIILLSLWQPTRWPYPAGEWLLNYGGGFSRRGLAGEILQSLPVFDSVVWVSLFVIALVVTTNLLFAILIQRTIVVSRTWWPMLWWLLPGGLILGVAQSLAEPGMTWQFFAMRKEYLFFAALICYALLLGQTRTATARLALAIGAGLALATLALVHEAFAVPTAVAAALIALPTAGRAPNLRESLPLLLPPIAVTGAIVITSAGRGTGQAQWAAVDESTRTWLLGFEAPGLLFEEWGRAPFRFLDQGSGYGYALTHTTAIETGYWRSWLLVALIMAVWCATAMVLSNRQHRARSLGLATMLVVATLMLPLSVIAADWGRWLVFVAITTAIAHMGRTVQPSAPPATPVPVSRPALAVAALLAAVALSIYLPEIGAPVPMLVGPMVLP